LSYKDILSLFHAHPNICKFNFLLKSKEANYTPNSNWFWFDDRKPEIYILEGEGWRRKQVHTMIEKTCLQEGWYFIALDKGIQGSLIFWRWRPAHENTC
jgi:hypothetical protein